MRVEFISATGGKMFVDESRKQEYVEAGYMLASNVVDVTFKEDSETEEKKPVRRRRK